MKTAILILLMTATALAFTPTIVNFNGGQVGWQMEARTDFAKYAASNRTIENFLVNVAGPAIRRPGTYFVAETKSSNEARLVPFEVSTEDNYILEFTNGFLRFYREED